MQFLVPTYGRASQSAQSTLAFLRSLGIEPTLVVQDREKHKYNWHSGPLAVLPPEITTIAPTRDHIIQALAVEEKVIMLDDDLVFFRRRDDDRTKFESGTKEDFLAMFEVVSDLLDKFPHVGIASREGGNRNTDNFMFNTRIMRVLAYRADIMKNEGITYAPMALMSDFHVNLQFLRKGYDTVVVNNWCQNHGGSDTAGGCSHFRTKELLEENAHLLKSLHPEYVKVVKKETKGAWGGGARTDVTIQWKKARNESNRRTSVLDN